MGERLHGMQEVRGSTPLGSTTLPQNAVRFAGRRFARRSGALWQGGAEARRLGGRRPARALRVVIHCAHGARERAQARRFALGVARAAPLGWRGALGRAPAEAVRRGGVVSRFPAAEGEAGPAFARPADAGPLCTSGDAFGGEGTADIRFLHGQATLRLVSPGLPNPGSTTVPEAGGGNAFNEY